ncbi:MULTISPECIES: hypothetical protein [Enterobacterales]|uniref:hypothetical protein n=1 Tax=Enterobacterales TaxID=91347 RepID=UPI002EDB65F9
MSDTAAWTYTNACTVYPIAGKDDWSGANSYGAPYLISATWGTDNALSGKNFGQDELGTERVHNRTIYTESKYNGESVRIPLEGDYIALGDRMTEADPIKAGADEITKVHEDDMSFFDEDPDYKVETNAS